MPRSPTAAPQEADVAVVGAGAAGLYAALCAARAAGARRARLRDAAGADGELLGAGRAGRGARRRRQLRAAPARHRASPGAALVRRSAAEILVREAPERVHDLQALGVRFDADRFGALALGLEGGHSVRRVVHAGGSATGRRVVRQLSALAVAGAAASRCSRARGRGPCGAPRSAAAGVACEDGRVIAARAVVIATGGAAALWARTTNPPGSQGVGLLLAHARRRARSPISSSCSSTRPR